MPRRRFSRILPVGLFLILAACILSALSSTTSRASGLADAFGQEVKPIAAGRILTLGSDVTEIVYALGQGDRVIGLDRGSRYPADTSTKPDVGYRRQLSPEGVLSLDPDLIIATEDIGPPDSLDVLRSLEIPLVFVPEDNSGKGIERKIALIAAALGREADGRALSTSVRQRFDQAVALAAAIPREERKKVVFFHGLVRLSVAGAGTAADAIIRYAGGLNPMDEVTGYRAASEERLVELAPDVILMMSDGRGGPTPDEVFSNRALAATPAARAGSLIVLDGAYMIGFGPRTADAIRDLAVALYDRAVAAPD